MNNACSWRGLPARYVGHPETCGTTRQAIRCNVVRWAVASWDIERWGSVVTLEVALGYCSFMSFEPTSPEPYSNKPTPATYAAFWCPVCGAVRIRGRTAKPGFAPNVTFRVTCWRSYLLKNIDGSSRIRIFEHIISNPSSQFRMISEQHTSSLPSSLHMPRVTDPRALRCGDVDTWICAKCEDQDYVRIVVHNLEYTRKPNFQYLSRK